MRIGKDFFYERRFKLALSKERKEEVLAQYNDWMSRSEALILLAYKGASVQDMEEARAKVRESGGEFHVVQNRLAKLAIKANDLEVPEGYFENSTAIGFAFEDVASTAKALADTAKEVEAFEFKGGYMGAELLSPEQVVALSKLPSLPEMRAKLLGTIQAPMSQLVRTLAEPARGLAAVIKAYSEESAAA
jgi:large subunit ribosomal protein L10